MAKRRALSLCIPKDFLFSFLRENKNSITKDIPEDAKIIDVRLDHETDSIVIVTESIEFPLAESGMLLERKGITYLYKGNN